MPRNNPEAYRDRNRNLVTILSEGSPVNSAADPMMETPEWAFMQNRGEENMTGLPRARSVAAPQALERMPMPGQMPGQMPQGVPPFGMAPPGAPPFPPQPPLPQLPSVAQGGVPPGAPPLPPRPVVPNVAAPQTQAQTAMETPARQQRGIRRAFSER